MKFRKVILFCGTLWLPLQVYSTEIFENKDNNTIYINGTKIEKIKRGIVATVNKNKYLKVGLYAASIAVVGGLLYNMYNRISDDALTLELLSTKVIDLKNQVNKIGPIADDIQNLSDQQAKEQEKGIFFRSLSNLGRFSWTAGFFLVQQVCYGRAFKSLDSCVDNILNYPGDLSWFINNQTSLCNHPNDVRYLKELHYYAGIIDNKVLYAPRKVQYARSFLLDARFILVHQVEKILGYMDYVLEGIDSPKKMKTLQEKSVYLIYCTNQLSDWLYECATNKNTVANKKYAQNIEQFAFEFQSVVNQFADVCQED